MILQALAPELTLLITALFVLGLGVSCPASRRAITGTALLGGLLAATALLSCPVDGAFLNGMLVFSPIAAIFRLVILVLALAAVVFSLDGLPGAHFAESIALMIFGTIGMMLLAAAEDLLMIFLALELASIPLYVLAAMNKKSRASAEAGLKYFLIGSVSAAFLLYGLSLIFGVAGSTSLHAIAAAGPDPLLTAGIVLALGGFAFKVAAVPFQLRRRTSMRELQRQQPR